MPLAAKHFDIVIGIDVHIVQPPGTVPPAPIPHPFVGIVFDPFDYIPFLGATVFVNGLPRAQAGSVGFPIPAHVPIGGVFVKPPNNECALFMGSATVEVEGEPFAYLGLPVLSCSDIGMPPPPRFGSAVDSGAESKPKPAKKKSAPMGLFAPTSIVLSIPMGAPVDVGGPPTISLAAVTGLAALGALKAGARKLRKLKEQADLARKLSDRLHRRAKTVMDRLGVSDSTRHKVHTSLCSLTGHPVDVATGKVLTEAVDIDLPGPLPFVFERTWYSTSTYRGPIGHGWHHAFDLALTIDNDLTVVRLADGRTIAAPRLAVGESWFDRREKLTLTREPAAWVLRDREGMRHRFADPGIGPGGVVGLTEVEDLAGNRVAFVRDDAGRLTSIVDSGGRNLTVINDAQGRITEIRGPHPERDGECALVRYVYDRAGDLIEVHDALGHVFRYAYRNHLLVRETNRADLSFYFEYDNGAGPQTPPDPLGAPQQDARCLRTWGDGGIYDHRLEYEADHTKVTNSLGFVDTYYFNDDGLVERAVDPLGHEASVRYDRHTNKLTETDDLGRTTRFVHDERGNLVERIWPDGTTVRFAHDANDQLIRAIDQNGGWWQWRRDERGRLLQRLDPSGARTTWIWRGAAVESLVDARGAVTDLEYDAADNLAKLRRADGTTMTWAYDRLGRRVGNQTPTGATERVRRDLAGRVIETHEADGTRRFVTRDGEGRPIRVRDPYHETELSWGGLDQLLMRREAGIETRFHYDLEERIIALTNAHGDRYTFERDARGDVIAEIGWAGDRTELERDAAGQIRQITRASGSVVKYTHNRVGKLERVLFDDGTFEQYIHRADGLLMSAINPTGKVEFERDAIGRIKREWQGEHWVESQFDRTGTRTGLRSSFGLELDVELDRMGQWSKLSARAGAARWVAETTRDAAGDEIDRSLPGGARDRWTRDVVGRPAQHHVWDGRATVQNTRYTWGLDARLQQILDAVSGTPTDYQHDELGRLAWSRHGETAELRIPDALGNIYRSAERIDRRYGKDGRLLWAEEPLGTIRYGYDDDWRRIRRVGVRGEESSYRWDAAGRLAAVQRPDGELVEFGYDALGRRVWKRCRGVTTRWIWDGDVILHEWTEGEATGRAPPTPSFDPDDDRTSFVAPAFVPLPASDAPPASRGFVPDDDETGYVEPVFVRRTAVGASVRAAPAGLITWISDPATLAPAAKLVAGHAYSVVCDHLGTPVMMLDESGRRVWEAVLSTWGARKILLGHASDCPHRFAGQYEDDETGLAYNRYRYFDPETGQYLCVDPIRLAGGLNSFAYVDDPLTAVDPLGLASTEGDGCRGVKFFRGMKAQSGQPISEASARALGVRPNLDIPVVEGLVHPGTGGMSVSTGSPNNLMKFRRPPQFGGTSKDPVWELSESELGPDLTFRQDTPTHGLIEPKRPMSIDEYQTALARLSTKWQQTK
jgi:RHS repeat-associated protein